MKQIRVSSLEKFLLTGVTTAGLPAHKQKSSHRRLAQLLATMFQRIPEACIRSMTLGTLWDVL